MCCLRNFQNSRQELKTNFTYHLLPSFKIKLSNKFFSSYVLLFGSLFYLFKNTIWSFNIGIIFGENKIHFAFTRLDLVMFAYLVTIFIIFLRRSVTHIDLLLFLQQPFSELFWKSIFETFRFCYQYTRLYLIFFDLLLKDISI